MVGTYQLIKQGNIEALEQLREVLKTIGDNHYCFQPSEFTSSSIGEHIRHVLDLYSAIFQADDKQKSAEELIDYDCRARGTPVESERSIGLALITRLLEKISELPDAALDQEADVKTEITLRESHSIQIRSNVARELVFTAAHTVHHCAIIRLIARIQGCSIDDNIGLAPATLTYLRGQTTCAP